MTINDNDNSKANERTIMIIIKTVIIIIMVIPMIIIIKIIMKIIIIWPILKTNCFSNTWNRVNGTVLKGFLYTHHLASRPSYSK